MKSSVLSVALAATIGLVAVTQAGAQPAGNGRPAPAARPADTVAPTLYDAVEAQRTGRERAAALLKDALQGFPEKLLVAYVPDQKPYVVENKPDQVKVEWNVVIGFNMAEYYRNVLPKLNAALGSLATQRVVSPIVSQAVLQDERQVSSTIKPNRMLQVLPGESRNPSPLLLALQQAQESMTSRQSFVVALNTGTNAAGDTLTWALFVLDEALYPAFVPYSRLPVRLHVRFLSRDGKVVKTHDVALHDFLFNAPMRSSPWLVLTQWPHDADGDSFLLSRNQEGNTRRFVSILPFVRSNYRTYTDKFTIKYTTTLTDSELRRIATIDCRILPQPPPGGAAHTGLKLLGW